MNNGSLTIQTSGPVEGTVSPPGSKSITNRALVCAALAEGETLLTGVLDSEDTQVMRDALMRIGFDLAHDPAERTARISGLGGGLPVLQREGPIDLYIANSGTTVRFLTSMLAVAPGRNAYRMHGTPRMGQRPIGDLLDALALLGADVRCENQNGCPPVVIRASQASGGETVVAGDISSQYLSGLLLAAPSARGAVAIDVEGELVSRPYVTATLAVMRAFGAKIQADDDLSRFCIPAESGYTGRVYAIEPDASAASYFFAAAAVTGGRVTVEGLSRKSLQGDVLFCDCLEQMGCEVVWSDDAITVRGRPLRGVTVDMNAISDTVQTLAVVAAFADGPTTITHVGHIRHKETDRIAAVAAELRKLGAEVQERDDSLTITPGPLQGAEIATYNDHRMAMSFAIAGLRQPGVEILDPGCTAKTYPEFFDDLAKIVRQP